MTIVLMALGVYLAIGALFAPMFSGRGAGAIDPNARAATWGFRVLVLPGAAALWPLLMLRWLRAARGGTGRGAAPASDSAEDRA